MSEWCPESLRIHSFEIATVDQNNNLIGGFPILSNGNPHRLPIESVGRIYTSNGDGTGFLYRSSRGLMVISSKHLLHTGFDPKPLEYIYVTFALKHKFRRDKRTNHNTHPEYRRLKPLPIDLEIFQQQFDPVTKCAYALPNDIIAFELIDICCCGRSVNPISMSGLRFLDTKPVRGEICVLLGYPGNISSETYALKSEANCIEVDNLEESLRQDRLVWTEGEIVESADLFAITNTSTAGMSGSPLLVRDTEGWKVCGVLAGGPAVIGHYYLLKLASVCHDQSTLQEVLKEFKDMADTQAPDRYPVPGLFQHIEILNASLTRENLLTNSQGYIMKKSKSIMII